ncbi:NLR family CARD domain-containing protein 3 [Clarias gariepinus]|uniref:NLR family CARD domain-containing protein 3 n=1 Tax=Clarias gariepinus TaxID=13013 RepID=UPI00234CE614|nr:NLR family CARD domain-containing protein 3 [Clarias gariepinus]
MSDNDGEVEMITEGLERPPSSYGSMCSDDVDDINDVDDELQVAAAKPIIKVTLPTRVKLHRPDSPETGITSVTQDRQTSIHNEGVYYTTADRKESEPEEGSEFAETESYVFVREPQNRQRRNIQPQPTAPEPTPPLASATDPAHELTLPYVFTAMLNSLRNLNRMELGCFVHTLYSQCKGQLEFRQLQQEGEMDVLGVVDRMLEKWDKGEALHITVRTLHDINKRDLAGALESVCRRALVQYELRASHKRRYYSLYEGTCRPGQQRYIKHVYVETPIVLETPNNERTPIRTADLFTPAEGGGHIRVVVTTGVPAVGLTVNVQAFIMDWTEEHAFQDTFWFVFALPGRDLHLVRNSEQTFLEFLSSFYPEAKHAEFLAQDRATLFIIDALELCRQPLDFQNNPTVTNITTPARADVLLTSLIKGDLLPHARIWITSCRSAFRKLPANSISRFTELKGFGNAQKDEYFTKRTKDRALGQRVLDHVKGFLPLYDACYLPLFSWIVSFVYERRLLNRGITDPEPAVATFYMQYIIVLTNRKIERYVGTGFDASRWKDSDKDFLMKMGKLALRMTLDGQDIFYEDTVYQYSLEMDEVTHRSGISSETNEASVSNGRSFRFVHPNIQKFMAALYVYVKFRGAGENVLQQNVGKTKSERPVSELFKPTIDYVLARRDGDMDLFLRFLLGLATRSAEMHLRGHLLPQYHPEPKAVDDVIKHIKKSVQKKNAIPERCRNLELCLTELEESRNAR